MRNKKTNLMTSKTSSADTGLISPTVRFQHNRRKGLIEPLSAQEKMLCALRKALAHMSDSDPHGCRYYISGKVKILQAPRTTQGKEGEPQSYRARGRCRVRLCHPQGHTSSKVIAFDISYRDVKDEMGLADVQYFDPTTIDELPRNTPIEASVLA